MDADPKLTVTLGGTAGLTSIRVAVKDCPKTTPDRAGCRLARREKAAALAMVLAPKWNIVSTVLMLDCLCHLELCHMPVPAAARGDPVI